MKLRSGMMWGMVGAASLCALVSNTNIPRSRELGLSSRALMSEPTSVPMKYTQPLAAVIPVEKRQDYLDSLVNSNAIPHCQGIVYDHYGTNVVEFFRLHFLKGMTNKSEVDATLAAYTAQMKDGAYDAKVPEFIIPPRDRCDAPIFVGRGFFEDTPFTYFTTQDRQHFLKNLQGGHLQEIFEGGTYASRTELWQAITNKSASELTIKLLDILAIYAHGVRTLPPTASDVYTMEMKSRYGILLGTLQGYREEKKFSPFEERVFGKLCTIFSQSPVLRRVIVPPEYFEWRGSVQKAP